MKKTVYILISFSFFLNTYSQETLDSAEIKCVYQLTFMIDSTNSQRKQSDILHLLIGNRVSDFYSYITYKADSAFKADIESGNIPFETVVKNKDLQKKYTPGSVYTKYNLSVDNQAKKISITDRIGTKKYFYEEKMDTFVWKIFPDTMTILNYVCQKAHTYFKGRDYTAWFTSEIPVNAGPYKFNGLPGLIVKISDTKENYIFECLSVEKLIKKIPVQLNVSNCIKTTRSEFRKAFKAGFDNPWQSLTTGSDVTFGGRDIDKVKEMLQKSIPYNPIELE